MTGLLRPLLLPPPACSPLKEFWPAFKNTKSAPGRCCCCCCWRNRGPLCSVFLTPRADLRGSRCVRRSCPTLHSSSQSSRLWSSSPLPARPPPKASRQDCQRVVDQPLRPAVIFSLSSDAPLASVPPRVLRRAHLRRVSAVTSSYSGGI